VNAINRWKEEKNIKKSTQKSAKSREKSFFFVVCINETSRPVDLIGFSFSPISNASEFLAVDVEEKNITTSSTQHLPRFHFFLLLCSFPLFSVLATGLAIDTENLLESDTERTSRDHLIGAIYSLRE
jgi:hypothetical protein